MSPVRSVTYVSSRTGITPGPGIFVFFSMAFAVRMPHHIEGFEQRRPQRTIFPEIALQLIAQDIQQRRKPRQPPAERPRLERSSNVNRMRPTNNQGNKRATAE